MIPVRVAQEKNTRNAADSTKRRHCGAHRMVTLQARMCQSDRRETAHEEAQFAWNYHRSRVLDGSAYLNPTVAQERRGDIRQ